MKEETRGKLRESALALFSSGWYEDVSVAQICRSAGLSNGIFYFYYPDKEAIFEELIDDYFSFLEEGLRNLEGTGTRERFDSFYRLFIGINAAHRRNLAVFRQGLILHPAYETRLSGLFQRKLESILHMRLSPGTVIFLVSGIRFLMYRSFSTGLPLAVDAFLQLMWNGVFSIGTEDFLRVFREEVREVPEDEEPKTVRERIVRAGRALFLERGFHGVNVLEIVRSLGISVGSFYFHVSGKKELEAAVITSIGHNLRRFININVGIRISRFEQELRGWYLFIEYFRGNPRGYRLIREAEFVVPETVKEYYDRLEAGYVKNLKDLRIEDRVTAANLLLGVASYVGIRVLFMESRDALVSILEEISGCLIGGIGGLVSGQDA